MYPVRVSGICVLLLASLAASAEQLPVRIYTIEDGLPGNRVNRIVRDSRGFLWFCAQDGLARFDGLQFANFGRAQGLPEHEVTDLLEGPSGDYWIASSGGLYRLPRQGQAYKVTLPDSNDPPYALATDRSGTLWIASETQLFQMSASGSPNEHPVQVKLQLPGEVFHPVSTLLVDSAGVVWTGTDYGVVRRWPDGRIDRYTGLPGVCRMVEDRNGRIWLGTYNGLYRTTRGEFGKPGAVELMYRESSAATWIIGLLKDSRGKVVIGLERRIGELDADAPAGTPISWKYTVANGLADSFYFSLAEDIAGNLWVGGEGRGAMKIVRAGLVSYGTSDGMESNRVLSLFPDRQGTLMAYTTLPPVLNRWDGRRFTPHKLNFPPGVAAAWGWQQIVLQDRQGEWWIATQQGVLHYAAMPAESLAAAAPKDWFTPKDGLAGQDVFHIYEDRRGDIWIATTGRPEQNGLSRWERASGRLHHYSVRDGLPYGYCPTVFTESADGTLWAGSVGWLGRYRDGRFEAVANTPALGQSYIRDLLFDGKGRLWIGGAPGLFRIDDPTAARVSISKQFTVADGLSSEIIYTMVRDRLGRIYVGGKRGLDRLDPISFPAPGSVRHLSQADGLAPGYLRASYCDRNGDIWFGALSGLSRLTPQPDPPAPQAPEVWITGLMVRNNPVAISKFGEQRVSPLVLDPSNNQLQVQFSSLNFRPGETSRFQYKLRSDDEWSAPSAERTINYGSLASGRYRLAVRAVGANGLMSPEPAMVEFTVLPPIWQRWWFFALCAAALAAIGYTLHRRRLAQALALARVRSAIADDLHDDIGSSLSQIAILSEVAQRQPNGDAIQQIAGTARELVDAMSDIVWAINPQHDRLDNLVHRMRRFAEETLGARNIRLTFNTVMADGSLRIPPEIRRQVFLVVKEAIANIAKHSDASSAWIELTLDRTWLHIDIRDDGRGFDLGQDSDGNGLITMRRRIEAIGGVFRLESSPGGGTRMRASIALAKTRQPLSFERGA